MEGVTLDWYFSMPVISLSLIILLIRNSSIQEPNGSVESISIYSSLLLCLSVFVSVSVSLSPSVSLSLFLYVYAHKLRYVHPNNIWKDDSNIYYYTYMHQSK